MKAKLEKRAVLYFSITTIIRRGGSFFNVALIMAVHIPPFFRRGGYKMNTNFYNKLIENYRRGRFVNSARERIFETEIRKFAPGSNLLYIGGSLGVNFEFVRYVAANLSIHNLDLSDLDHSYSTVGSAEYIDSYFSKGQFDLIVAGEVLEHLVYPDKFILRSFDILRPGGVLLASTPNLDSWTNKLLRYNYRNEDEYREGKAKVDNLEFTDLGHINVMSIDRLKGFFLSSGFSVVNHIMSNYTEESSWGSSFPWSFPIRGWINYVIPDRFREQQIIVAFKN